MCAACLAATLAPGTARAGEVVLFVCDDASLGQGPGGCDGVRVALGLEVADYGLEVIVPECGLLIEQAEVQGLSAIHGARFAVWFSREADGQFAMHVFDPGTGQTLSRSIVAAVTDPQDVYTEIAFRLRSLMGASLYSDLDDLVAGGGVASPLVQLAVPKEQRVILVKLLGAPAAWRPWARVYNVYSVVGYPATTMWLDGVGLGAAVIPVDRLEVVTDLVVAFGGHSSFTPEPGVTLRFSSLAYLVRVGVRFEVLRLGPLAVMPAAGLSLGVSRTTVVQDGAGDHVHVNGALWGGLDLRVDLVPRFGLVIGARFENLFNHETFRYKGEAVYGPSQFRFSATAGVCVTL